MSLPLINVFIPNYEIWETRDPTYEEMLASRSHFHPIKVSLIKTIANAYDAAVYMGSIGADNGLGNFINEALDNSVAYKCWRRAMPSKTPKPLLQYKNEYPHCDFEQISKEIEAIEQVLSTGQYLFHAGLWPNVSQLITTRPLSSSFCPQVALRNADHQGKGYDAGRIDLFVLRVTAPRTKVFAYKRKGISLGHENEVVFAAGAKLSLVSTTVVNTNYPAGKWGYPDTRILVRVLEIDIT